MKTIGVYKIGLSRYIDKEDVNSGAFERQLIIDNLVHEALVVDLNEDTVHHLSSKQFDSILIIGGMMTTADLAAANWFLEHRLYNTKCRLIFIASDIDCIYKLSELINSCDYCLTQTDYKFPHIQVPQLYSYLPELFFSPREKEGKVKMLPRHVFFAGSADGREDLLRKYLFQDDRLILSRPYTMSLIKTRNFDNRVKYQEQLDLLAKHGYTLMIVTKECREIGWITSRLFEALSVGTIPLFDVNYDTHCRYCSEVSVLRVSCYNSMMRRVQQPDGPAMVVEFANMHKRASINSKKFIDLVFTLSQ